MGGQALNKIFWDFNGFIEREQTSLRHIHPLLIGTYKSICRQM
jgi:hypothetical protein